MNDIHTRATKNDIWAFINEDQIVATMLRSNGFDEVNDWLTGCCIEVCVAVVADDDIVTDVSRNELTSCRVDLVVHLVVADTGNHEVFTITNNDLVVATQAGVVRGRRSQL